MKKIYAIGLPSLLIISLAVGLFLNQEKHTDKRPLPYDTQIVDKEEEGHHLKKQEWIENMHRAAPEDNWRSMDQQYRLNNMAHSRENSDLPIYGKWRELGSNNQSGRTVFTYYDHEDEELLVASDGGQIWRGQLDSDDWEPINDHFKIPAIRNIRRLDVNGNSRLLVHSAAWNISGIMYSDNDGQDWTAANGLESIESWGFIKRMAVVDSLDHISIYCLSQEWDYDAWKAISRLYVSVDYGENFQVIHSFDHGVNTMDIFSTLIYGGPLVILDETISYFLDGNQLSFLGTLPTQETGTCILTGSDMGGPGVRYYAMVRSNSVSHFFSFAFGGGWVETGSLSQGPFMQNSFMASQFNEDVLYFGGIEAFVSHDAGANWTLVNSWVQYYNSPEDKLHADIPCFNSFDDGSGNEILFVNTDGGTYTSDDQMANVQNISLNNLNISQYYSTYTCRFDPSFTHAGAQDQGYQRSDEGMNEAAINYDQIISGDYGNMVSGDGGASIWMVYPGFAMYGPNINNTDQLIFEDFVGANYQWIPKLMEDPSDPENVFLAGGHISSGAHIMLLDRSGYGITTTELPFDFSNGTAANISAMAYSKINTDYRYVLTSEKDFFTSEDAGNNWSMTSGFEGPGSHYFYGASIAPSNTELGLLYVGGSGYSNPGVFRSGDNGQTFEDFSSGLPSTMVFQIVLSPDDSLLFAATEVGAFVCKTWEAQWYALADEVVPDQAFWAVDFVDTLQVARFATYGRGVWDFELKPSVEAGFTSDKVYIYKNETIDFLDLSIYQPSSWNWYFEGGQPEVSSEQHPQQIMYANAGAYDVQLIVSNDYSTDTLLMQDYISVGTVSIADIDEPDISLYPNPASSYFTLDCKEKVDQLLIYSSTGTLVLSIQEVNMDGNSIRVDISNLDKGSYVVKAIYDGKSATTKLIKR